MDKLYGEKPKYREHRETREPREHREPREPRVQKDHGFKDDEMVAVKIRGMLYQTRYEQVSDFFKDFKFIP